MERLNWHMADELSRHADVRIIAPAGAAASAPASLVVYEVPLKPLWKFLIIVQWVAWRVARTWKADVVLAGSGLTAPAVWFASHGSDAQSAAYVHGLDLAVHHPLYRCLWRPALRHMNCVIANSRATAALAKAIGIDQGRIGIVNPGVDLPVDSIPRKCGDLEVGKSGKVPKDDCVEIDRLEFRRNYQLGSRPLLLSVGRLSTRKGLREFVENSLPRIASVFPEVLLIVVGDEPKDALGAQAQTRESIQAVAELAGLGTNLRFLGTVTDYQVLGSIYLAADVHVFPVRDIKGDPEGFGMVAVEAAAHGLPTVAFSTGGIVDAVAEGESGRLVQSGDYVGFAQAVLSTISESGALRDSCQIFAQKFAWNKFGREISRLLGVVDRNIDSPEKVA
ncbi:glycosyltransferase family 4 protein [Dyella sp.]|uniref:glycosyltransferase family 4 protein n=1 Tax=Dyella sp. TaxID=1869338 RepID=UPI003F7FCB90